MSKIARSIGTAITFSCVKIFEDPWNFLSLFGKYIGLEHRRLNFLSRVWARETNSNNVRNHLKEGNYSKAINSFRNAGVFRKISLVGSYFSAKRLEKRLSLPIVDSCEWSDSDHINVLYFVNNSMPYTLSGYSVRTESLVEAVRPKVDSVLKVTRLGYPAVVGRIAPSDSKNLKTVVPLGMPFREEARMQMAVNMIIAICREENVSVLHTTTDFGNAQIISRVSRRLRIPWIYEMRGEPHKTWALRSSAIGDMYESEYFLRCQALELESAKKASAVITLSDLQKNSLVTAGVQPEKITVLGNSVDASLLNAERESCGKSEVVSSSTRKKKRIVGTVTSVVPYEGLETLIKAIKFLPEDVHVLIVGDGEDRVRLQELSQRMHTSSRVKFVGKQPNRDIEKWYRELDVFVVPRCDVPVARSVTPLKPLMALALGIPVVASDLPALREATGGFARYFEAEDEVALASAIVEVLNSPDDWTAPLEWLETRTWERNACSLSKLYNGLVQRSE